MIKIFISLAIVCGVMSCRMAKQPDVQQTDLPSGEVEIIVPCSGPEYFTDDEVFRSNAVGESLDLSVSKRKAMTNARAELAASIQTTVKAVTDSYVKSIELDNQEEVEERFESLNREVVSQELRGLRKTCERFFRTPEGTYKTYVTLELSAEQLVSAYHQRLLNNQQLKIDYDYEKFKEAFVQEMINRDQK